MADPMPDPAEGETLLPIDRSGARELVGYRSSIPEAGGGVCTLAVGPQHLNRLGLLHGGFVSMLLDNGCGVAVRNAIDDIDASAVTVSLSVNFLAGTGAGRVVTATGRVTGGGHSLKFAESELRDDAGRLLATGSATFRILRKRG